jgi:predicted ATPase
LVELAHIGAVDDMVQAVAEAIGVPLLSDQPELEQLLQYLASKRLLLVMDNFEHLTTGATLVTDILHAAPSVDVLVTSRARLTVTGQTVLRLPGLQTEWDTPQQALDASSVQLFVNTAQRADAGFTLAEEDLDPLREILTIVEGMPLGIMLAAAWANMLPIAGIAAEIHRSLDFLETELRDLPERHGSIRAVFHYSWALLDDNERGVFSALSVFRGGFTRDAAECVAGASLRTLASLAAKSFLTTDRETGRFSIHELLRQYGSIELAREPERLEETADRHAAFYSDLTEDAFDVIRASDQPRALRMMDADVENMTVISRLILPLCPETLTDQYL